jgi:hypothetical protein
MFLVHSSTFLQNINFSSLITRALASLKPGSFSSGGGGGLGRSAWTQGYIYIYVWIKNFLVILSSFQVLTIASVAIVLCLDTLGAVLSHILAGQAG